jgi:hypothetical protein
MSEKSRTCEQPSERKDGTLCGFPADAVVDVVRREDDGSATFFTLPLCLGHRLALGEFVVYSEPLATGEAG